MDPELGLVEVPVGHENQLVVKQPYALHLHLLEILCITETHKKQILLHGFHQYSFIKILEFI